MGHMDARERIESGWPALDRLVSEVLGTRREVAAAQAREARLLADAVDLVTERVAERRLQGERVSDADLPLREVSLELGMAMRVSDRTIQGRMGDASTLVTRFVTTFEAWQRGRVDAGHVWAIVRAGIGITDEGGREAYERLALEAAATESAGRMGRVAREIAAAVSPEDFAAEVRNAFAERMVRVYDLDGGMARILADLPAPLAYAIADRLTEFAEHALAAEPEDDEDACSDGEEPARTPRASALTARGSAATGRQRTRIVGRPVPPIRTVSACRTRPMTLWRSRRPAGRAIRACVRLAS